MHLIRSAIFNIISAANSKVSSAIIENTISLLFLLFITELESSECPLDVFINPPKASRFTHGFVVIICGMGVSS